MPPSSEFTVGSLFSGIGGLELGLERAGMRTVWQAETDPYASAVLRKHWPDVPNLGDVSEINWAEVVRPTVVCGGFPCQPVSLAGRRMGDQDARWLWPEVARCLRDLRPRYAILENVPGLLSRGFGDVLGDLASLGFDAEWGCIPAAAVGAPHLRWRVFLVAHSQRIGSQRRGGTGNLDGSTGSSEGNGEKRQRVRDASDDCCTDVADSHGDGCSEGRLPVRPGGPLEAPIGASGNGSPMADSDCFPEDRPSESRTERGHWLLEPDVGRVANGVPKRMDRLRCLGNAVVPQVAEKVGRTLIASHRGGE